MSLKCPPVGQSNPIESNSIQSNPCLCQSASAIHRRAKWLSLVVIGRRQISEISSSTSNIDTDNGPLSSADYKDDKRARSGLLTVHKSPLSCQTKGITRSRGTSPSISTFRSSSMSTSMSMSKSMNRLSVDRAPFLYFASFPGAIVNQCSINCCIFGNFRWEKWSNATQLTHFLGTWKKC